jgi:hypothetical protein
MSSLTAPIRHAPLDLWRIAGAFLQSLHVLFGAPEDVARRDTYTRKPYELLAAWIRCGEALLRRLLLIEATQIEIAPNACQTRAPRQRARKLMHFSADEPEAWRVSFPCFGPPASSRLTIGRQDAGGPSKPGRWPSATKR